VLSGLQDEQRELDQFLANSDLSYSKIDGLIATKAAAASVPYIQPYYVSPGQNDREEILIDRYDESMDLLLGKLTNVSNYVANLSGEYKEHKFGSWVFSGPKTYVLTIRPPQSTIIEIERSSSLINDMLASVSESARALQKG